MNKKLLSLLFFATPFFTFAQEKGLDQKIDEAFGNATRNDNNISNLIHYFYQETSFTLILEASILESSSMINT